MSKRQSTNLFERIIVGVGGSQRSYTALTYALAFGEHSSEPVTAVIVDTIRVNMALGLAHGRTLERLLVEAERLSEEEGDRIEEQALEIAQSSSAELRVIREEGSVVDRLSDASSSASLVVVGKRGYRDDHSGFLGTNTELLTRSVHSPILLTPDRFHPLRRVVVAYTAKESGDANMRSALQICERFNTSLLVATVDRDRSRGESTLDRARGILAGSEVRASFEVSAGRVADELCGMSRKDSLLLLGASGHSRAYRFLLGDITVETMRRAPGPVLISGRHT